MLPAYDLREVDALDEKLKRIDTLSVFQPRYACTLSWRGRLLFGAVSLIPRFRDMHQLLRYEFVPGA